MPTGSSLQVFDAPPTFISKISQVDYMGLVVRRLVNACVFAHAPTTTSVHPLRAIPAANCAATFWCNEPLEGPDSCSSSSYFSSNTSAHLTPVVPSEHQAPCTIE